MTQTNLEGPDIFEYPRGAKFEDTAGGKWHVLSRLVSPHSGEILYHIAHFSARGGQKEDWVSENELNQFFTEIS